MFEMEEQNIPHTSPPPSLLLSDTYLSEKVRFLANEITTHYLLKKPPVCVCILEGAVFFFTDLVRKIYLPVELGFMQYSSYEGVSQKELVLATVPAVNFFNKNILLVDMLVDTGVTMSTAKAYFENKEVLDVKTCALLVRAGTQKPDFYGVEITEKEFLVGYGLDLSGKYRNWTSVYTVRGSN